MNSTAQKVFTILLVDDNGGDVEMFLRTVEEELPREEDEQVDLVIAARAEGALAILDEQQEGRLPKEACNLDEIVHEVAIQPGRRRDQHVVLKSLVQLIDGHVVRNRRGNRQAILIAGVDLKYTLKLSGYLEATRQAWARTIAFLRANLR